MVLPLHPPSPGRHRILSEFCPEVAMLEASTQELIDERQEALDTLQELGLRT